MGRVQTSSTFAALAFLVPLLSVGISTVRAGNTTCASGQLDWYTSVVGESPCVTYERLRQICNPDYQVPSFRPDTPGDQCDDQVSSCCCNTVAFQLSMLCMNCQYDKQEGDSIGIDAGIGAYRLYQFGCGAGTNRSLPDNIQTAVCNKNIRLDNFLYGGWDDGSWYYVYTKESAGVDHAVHNDNTFTHCPDQISPSVTPTPSSSTKSASSHDATPTDSSQTHSSTDGSSKPSQTSNHQSATDNANNDTKQSHTSAIVGGVVGGVGALVLVVVGVMFWRLRRRGSFGTPATQDSHYEYRYHDTSPMGSATPFAASLASRQGPGSPPGGAPPMTSPGADSAYPSTWGDNPYFPNASPPLVPVTSQDSLRHEDGGPVPGLVRSASGRLPPAYRSWEQSTASGSVVGSGSQVSEPQSFGSAAAPSVPELQMPLAPLRRSATPTGAATSGVGLQAQSQTYGQGRSVPVVQDVKIPLVPEARSVLN